MNEALESDEQFRKLKEWWKQHGVPATGGAVLAFALLGGYNWWDARQSQRGEAASELFGEMLGYVDEEQPELAADAARRLIEEYGGSDYAAQGAQVLARLAAQDEDWEEARARLQWVVDNHAKPATVHAARLRLARILIEAGDTEAAETLLAIEEQGGFTSYYLELQADILAAQGKAGEARTRYQKALGTLPQGSSYRSLLQLKLQDTAVIENEE